MNAKIKRVLSLFLACFLFLALTCCSESSSKSKTIEIKGVTTLFIGDSITLEAVFHNFEGDVTWSTSDETIATVDNGLVTGKSAGEVKITATSGEIFGELNIMVKEKTVIKDSLFCGVNIVSEELVNHEKIELALVERNPGFIKENYNPFDYKEIKVYAVFTSEDYETSITAVAFWYRDYNIKLNTGMSTGKVKAGEPDGLEMVEWVGDYEYRIRFQPSKAGKWTYRVYIEYEDAPMVQELDGELDVVESTKEYHGLIQIDKSNNRTFMYQDGTTFMPIGENMGWWADNSRKTYDYQVWFENAQNNNMNIARVWLAPWGFCLHWGKSIYNLSDRMNFASRLDRLFDLAEKYDQYIMLTLINHGQFSAVTDATWSENPYNKANGGILDKPYQFFTSREARDVYQNELLYIIGRYGYCDHILCWELFNEVDWTDGYSAPSVNSWHNEMAKFIKNNDPYGHLVTTSYKTETGGSFALESIDFASPHSYGYAGKNICDTLPAVLDRLYNQYQKPILHAEIGIDWQNGYNNYKLDPTGINLRQNSWAGMMGGGAGGAMNWWWDSYVHPYDLYYQFKGAGAYAKKMDLTGSDYEILRTLAGVEKPSTVGLLGYRFNNRMYGYVYDVKWRYNNPTEELEGISLVVPFNDGTYKLTIYSALTCDVIETKDITVTGGKITIDLPKFTSDIAFIVEKGE